MLQLKNIKKDYVTSSETVQALRGIDIAFRDKEFVSVLGPSGCGKTTLLNIIGGLDHYTSGDLIINGKSTKLYRDRDWDVYRNHRVGFIFQSYNLIPHQTVLGNVELALTIAGIGKRERTQRAKRALDRVGLSGQYYKRPNQLSGGQCQRVAIARALVNDPEILLADEPTGALDTVTSVQIMNLIREIAGERLVIMVTHNPELAKEYSTRIISLRDGEVIEDTMPVSDEELLEYERTVASLQQSEPKLKKSTGKESAKMSPITALKLSARNLISKKARTVMVGVAGSIGIIGIAMVLAFSAGIKGYVASMQDDMLSGNPITITESTYDLQALTGMMNDRQKEEIIKNPNRVYISSLVEYLAEMDSSMENLAIENTITEEYIEYVKNMPSEYYNAMVFDYGFDLNNNLYTDFKVSADSEAKSYSVSMLTTMYTEILKGTEFKDYADYVGALVPSFAQLPSSTDYLLTQYDLVGEGSRFATAENEIMLVLNSEDELSDLLLARFGFFTQDEFLELVNKATEDDYDEELYRDSFAYDELLGKTLMWYPNDTVFERNEYADLNPMIPKYTYHHSSEEFSNDGATELKVVGILTPKDTVSFGSLSSGIYYTESFASHVLEENADSEIFEHISSIDESNTTSMALMSYYIPYTYSYVAHDGTLKENVSGSVGPSLSTADMMGSMMGQGTAFDHADMKERFIRSLGGNALANSVTIYPVSFDDKDFVTGYLDEWNTNNSDNEITYTDTLELVISMINTMIDIVSYALIAFTSISLVVSTVMIGIITYVSVVERIKEIGVIRSLGGRKRDVSNLFIAETFIIGLLSGIIGVGVTYGISAIVNLILKPIISYPNIAALPIGDALLMILLSVALTLISGVIPARSAARKDPVVALRTE
ncbi:MAG: ATP-binding cassette domain-containing protein [Clostridia bacterium]|nr:ATP-binding cassette domain-containing protein [Clostridia bacterium]